MTNWAKWIVALFAACTAILGITTFASARSAAVQAFKETTQPALLKQFDNDLLHLKSRFEADAAKRIDEFTSNSSKQFETQMNLLFADLSKFARDNSLKLPPQPAVLDATNRPMSGYVLRSFLTKSVNNTYLINTFRLNMRDKPNGNILGRQTEGTRVRMTEELGEWVRVEVQ